MTRSPVAAVRAGPFSRGASGVRLEPAGACCASAASGSGRMSVEGVTGAAGGAPLSVRVSNVTGGLLGLYTQ